MLYKSTRGGCDPVRFSSAILSGYAPDGGLYVPDTVPQVSLAILKAWSELSFEALCVEILSLYIGDEIPRPDLQGLIHRAFKGFSCSDVVPLVKLGDLTVAELFHGPTLAFKDFGQQVLCKLIDYFATREQRMVTAVVSTTGDTGPAAIEATQVQRVEPVSPLPVTHPLRAHRRKSAPHHHLHRKSDLG